MERLGGHCDHLQPRLLAPAYICSHILALLIGTVVVSLCPLWIPVVFFDVVLRSAVFIFSSPCPLTSLGQSGSPGSGLPPDSDRGRKVEHLGGEIKKETNRKPEELEASIFKKEPDDQFVQEGEDVVLHCVLSVPMTSTRNCYWKKDDKPVIVQHRYEFVSGEEIRHDCSIRIKSVISRMDNGDWRCGIKATSSAQGAQSKVAKVYILAVPEDPVIFINNEAVLNGSTAIIEDINEPPIISCESKFGNPAPNLWWLLDNHYVIGKQHQKSFHYSKLTLNSKISSRWNGQTLNCIATHPSYGLNRQRMSYIHLLVKYNTQNVNVQTDHGLLINADRLRNDGEVKLSCTADGYPPLMFYWERRINDSSPWQLFRIGQNITVFPMSGEFSCTATQTNGFAVRSAEVITVTGSPISTRAHIYIISFAGIGTVFAIIVLLGTITLLCQRRKKLSDRQNYHSVLKSKARPYNKTCLLTKSKHPENSLERILPNSANMEPPEPDYLTPIQVNSFRKSKEMHQQAGSWKPSNNCHLKNDDVSNFCIYQEILPFDNKTYA